MKRVKNPLDRGRAAPHGIVTRRSHLTRINLRRVKPLPLDLQVLPQRLKRTRVHTGCAKVAPEIPKEAIALLRREPNYYFFSMSGLSTTPMKWCLRLLDGVGYTNNFRWACAWQLAALIKGLSVTIEEVNAETLLAAIT